MQALRQIIDVKNHSLNIILPNDFNATKVEVIVLPMEDLKVNNTSKNFKRFSGCISKETAESLHKHIEQVRNEWR